MNSDDESSLEWDSETEENTHAVPLPLISNVVKSTTTWHEIDFLNVRKQHILTVSTCCELFMNNSIECDGMLSTAVSEIAENLQIGDTSWKKDLTRLVQVMSSKFTLIAPTSMTIEEGRHGSNSNFLISHVLTRNGGSAVQISQILLTRMRKWNKPLRIVYVLRVSALPHKNLEKYEELQILDCWVEVLITSNTVDLTNDLESLAEGRWVSVNAHRGWVDDVTSQKDWLARQCSQSWRKHSVCYCLAFSDCYTNTHFHQCPWPVSVLDLTHKYCPGFGLANLLHGRKVVKSMRALSVQSLLAWWTDYLPQLSQHYKTALQGDSAEATRNNANMSTTSASSSRSNASTLSAAEASSCPSTISALQHHPVYVLERFLRSDEVLHPTNKRVVSLVKGEAVYLQSHVERLRTQKQWREQLRQVNSDQAACPVKSIKKRKLRQLSHANNLVKSAVVSSSSLSSRGGGEEDDDDDDDDGQAPVRDSSSSKLYGSWQTSPIEVAPVVDDVIPVNSFGDVEVWGGNLGLVPRGAELLMQAAASQAAQLLGLPSARAIVGFEWRDGAQKPVLRGTVVLSHHAAVIAEAADSIQHSKDAAKQDKHSQDVLARWRLLVRLKLSREELRVKYGH